MNKRQAKKKFKKEYETVDGMLTDFEYIVPGFRYTAIKVLEEMIRTAKNTVEQIKAMPDDKFDEMCSQLSTESQVFARRIRKDCHEKSKTQ